jgi:hypothetical protein
MYLLGFAGRPEEAADGIKFLMCVDSGEAKKAFLLSMGNGVDGIKEEVERLEAGQYGTAEDVAEVKALLHYILYEGTSEKKYKNGIRDFGRPPGTKLEYFLNHDNAKKARLDEAEVVALRFYTTLAYIFMNIPLRDEKRRIDGNPCPLPVTTAFAEEGIKKLRKLNAPDKSMTQESPSHSKSRQGMRTLYRGMRSMKAADDFLELGGTELAFMSTTTSLEVCQSQPSRTCSMRCFVVSVSVAAACRISDEAPKHSTKSCRQCLFGRSSQRITLFYTWHDGASVRECERGSGA